MSKLSTLIKEYRGGKGWTTAELADRSGVPIQTVSRYQNDRWTGKPQAANVIQIAHALEIPDAQWMAAIDLPLKRSESAQVRDDRYTEIVALTEDDSRFSVVAEMWKTGTEEQKDAALTVLESIFSRSRNPARRRFRPRKEQ